MASKRWRCPKYQPATSQLPKWQVMQMTPLPSERASAMCSQPVDPLTSFSRSEADQRGRWVNSERYLAKLRKLRRATARTSAGGAAGPSTWAMFSSTAARLLGRAQ